MKWLLDVRFISAVAMLSLAGCSSGDMTSNDHQPLAGNDQPSGAATTPNADAPARLAADAPYADPLLYSAGKDGQLAQAQEAAAVTHRTLTVHGKTFAYTATAGHLTAYNATTAVPDASVFYIAYTADGSSGKSDPSRPVTFLYNGGPGSSSIWLLMGSFGPVRIITDMPNPTPPAPFNIVMDNAESILDKTDMVFIDAVGTGLTTAVSPKQNQDFWGVDSDANVFSEFIFRYLTVNDRWNSPKFLLGESYGTTRSAVLGLVLQNAGIELNGIGLQSSILNYKTNANAPGSLPSLGVSAWYHKKVDASFQSLSAADFAAYLRKFSSEQYAPALDKLKNKQLNATDEAALAAQLQKLTGIDANTWITNNLVLGRATFRNTLLPGKVLGRYDARALGDATAGSFDPSNAYIEGVYVAMFESYLRNQLKYSTNSPFAPTTNVTWNFSHNGASDGPDVTPDLADTMVQNPDLKVLSLNGYYDLATPFFQTEVDIAGLTVDQELSKNVTFGFYESGHMSYLDNASRMKENADIEHFYDSVLADHDRVQRIMMRQSVPRGQIVLK